MKIFLDSADIFQIGAYISNVDGLTTNPTLLRSSGTKNYTDFAKDVLAMIGGKPVSFEVFGDDYDTMYEQAKTISSWGENVYVKIPVTNSFGSDLQLLIKALSGEGVKLNITAVMTREQIRANVHYLSPLTPAILSIFAGRIADTGRDPVPFITEAIRVKNDKTKVLWASTREVYNVTQAQQAGADIITISPALLQKMNEMKEMDLNRLSLMTVQQFHKDSQGLTL